MKIRWLYNQLSSLHTVIKNSFKIVHIISLITDYVQEIAGVVYALREKYPSYKDARDFVQQYVGDGPVPLASEYDKEDKSTLIDNHNSRFHNIMSP